jgi:hypothetical protein
MALCDTQGVARARSTEKDMETEDKSSMGGRRKAASQGPNRTIPRGNTQEIGAANNLDI